MIQHGTWSKCVGAKKYSCVQAPAVRWLPLHKRLHIHAQHMLQVTAASGSSHCKQLNPRTKTPHESAIQAWVDSLHNVHFAPQHTEAAGQHAAHVLTCLRFKHCISQHLKSVYHPVLPACQTIICPNTVNLIPPDEVQLRASKPNATTAAAAPTAASGRCCRCCCIAAGPCTASSEQHYCPPQAFRAAGHNVRIPTQRTAQRTVQQLSITAGLQPHCAHKPCLLDMNFTIPKHADQFDKGRLARTILSLALKPDTLTCANRLQGQLPAAC